MSNYTNKYIAFLRYFLGTLVILIMYFLLGKLRKYGFDMSRFTFSIENVLYMLGISLFLASFLTIAGSRRNIDKKIMNELRPTKREKIVFSFILIFIVIFYCFFRVF